MEPSVNQRAVRWLRAELPALVASGIISAENAQAIERYYEARSTGSPKIGFVLLAAVGSILVAAGIVLLIAHNWDEFSRPVRSVIAFLPLLAAQALSVFVLLRRNESKAWRECAAIFNVAAIGTAISLVSQTYQIHGSLANFIFVWILLSLPLVYLMRTTLGVWGSEGSELIIDTDSPQQQRWSMRRHERSVLRKTFRTVDSKL